MEMRYSVAIRTLGTNPHMLRTELESVFAQTLPPEKVVIYIAHGYKLPDFRVATEEYVYVEKGMLTQRARDYKEIDTPLILMLDDDVYLAPDSARILVRALAEGGYDCVSPDTFANHKMSAAMKLYSFFTNLTLPLRDAKYAFTIHVNGTLSFLDNPQEHRVYPSQSASGPCALWRKDAFLKNDYPSEMWLDTLAFSYAEDQLTYYKLYANGGRLGIYYGAGVEHRDGRVSRGVSYRGASIFFTRAKAQYIIWHRSVLGTRRGFLSKLWACTCMGAKLLWLLPVHLAASVQYRSLKVPYFYVKGTIDGIRFTHSATYRNLRPYLLK